MLCQFDLAHADVSEPFSWLLPYSAEMRCAREARRLWACPGIFRSCHASLLRNRSSGWQGLSAPWLAGPVAAPVCLQGPPAEWTQRAVPVSRLKAGEVKVASSCVRPTGNASRRRLISITKALAEWTYRKPGFLPRDTASILTWVKVGVMGLEYRRPQIGRIRRWIVRKLPVCRCASRCQGAEATASVGFCQRSKGE